MASAFTETFNLVIQAAERARAQGLARIKHKAFLKRQGPLAEKASVDLTNARQQTKINQQNIRTANIKFQSDQQDRQIAMMKGIISESGVSVKLLNDTAKAINQTAEPNIDELVQNHVAKSRALLTNITTRQQLNNFQRGIAGLPQLTPPELADRIALLYDGVTTKQIQRDAITSEDIAITKALAAILTDKNLNFRFHMNKLGAQGELLVQQMENKIAALAAGGQVVAPKSRIVEAEPRTFRRPFGKPRRAERFFPPVPKTDVPVEEFIDPSATKKQPTISETAIDAFILKNQIDASKRDDVREFLIQQKTKTGALK